MKNVSAYLIAAIKSIFWFIYANITILLCLICTKIYENFEKCQDNIKNIFFIYIILLTTFICSLFIKIKVVKYIIAFAVIGLFLYGSINNDTAEYFDILPLDD